MTPPNIVQKGAEHRELGSGPNAIKNVGDARQIEHTDILLTPFNSAYVLPLEPDLVGERFPMG